MMLGTSLRSHANRRRHRLRRATAAHRPPLAATTVIRSTSITGLPMSRWRGPEWPAGLHAGRVLLVLVLGLLAGLLPVRAQDMQVIAVREAGVDKPEGVSLKLRRPPADAHADHVLKKDDLLGAGADLILPARVEVELQSRPAGNRIVLLPGSRFKVHSVQARGEVHELLAGALRGFVIRPLDFFNVGFERFVALVRGTEFSLQAGNGEPAGAQLSEGRLRVESPARAVIGGIGVVSEGLAQLDQLNVTGTRSWVAPVSTEETVRRFANAAAAEAFYAERWAAAQASNDFDRWIAALNDLGIVRVSIGQPELALPLFQRGRAQAAERRDLPWLARMLDNLGAAELARQHWAEAAAYTLQGLAVNRGRLLDGQLVSPGLYPDGISIRVAGNLNNLGLARRGQGDVEGALRAFEEALQVHDRLPQPARRGTRAGVLDNLGNTLVRAAAPAPLCPVDDPRRAPARAQLDRGLAHLQAALVLRQQDALPGNDPEVARSLNNLGVAHALRCAPMKAEQYHREALSMRQALSPGNASQAVFESRINLGTALCRQGRLDACEVQYREALAEAERLHPGGLHRNLAQAHRALSQALRAAGLASAADAEAALAQAIEVQLPEAAR